MGYIIIAAFSSLVAGGGCYFIGHYFGFQKAQSEDWTPIDNTVWRLVASAMKFHEKYPLLRLSMEFMHATELKHFDDLFEEIDRSLNLDTETEELHGVGDLPEPTE